MYERIRVSWDALAPPELVDRVVGALVVLLGVGALVSLTGSAPVIAAGVVAVVIMVGALLVRHRRPRLSLAVVLAVVLGVSGASVFVPPALLGLFVVSTDCEEASVFAGAAATAGVLLLAPALHGHSDWKVAQIVSRLVVVVATVAFGLYRRARSAYLAELAGRAERVEREHALDAARAVAEERVRIARELHDVVAHSVSLMVVQTQAAAAQVAGARTDADAAVQATLTRVGDLGRDALRELHRLLGVLRPVENDGLDLAPQPGVEDLQALMSAAREGGLDVSFTDCGGPGLPSGLDLTVYRIVQEALTNVLRHARASAAEVILTRAGDAVEVEILDDGPGQSWPSLPGGAAGHGLLGMRERVALYGGSLEVGARDGSRGFRVHAVLPLPAASDARSQESRGPVSVSGPQR